MTGRDFVITAQLITLNYSTLIDRLIYLLPPRPSLRVCYDGVTVLSLTCQLSGYLAHSDVLLSFNTTQWGLAG